MRGLNNFSEAISEPEARCPATQMSTKWTYWKCERISWECLNVHTFQNPMWCLPMSLSHWVPLNSVPLAFLIEMFLVFYLLIMFLHSYLHAVSHVSSPCFSLSREVSWLQKKIDPIFKASWTLSVCIVWIGKWKTPKSTLEFVASSSSVLQGWWWMSKTYRRFIQLFGDAEKRW